MDPEARATQKKESCTSPHTHLGFRVEGLGHLFDRYQEGGVGVRIGHSTHCKVLRKPPKYDINDPKGPKDPIIRYLGLG